MILQGVAIVYIHQRQVLEKGVKGLLSDLNGDNLWSSVLKIQKAKLIKERREGDASRVKFRLEGKENVTFDFRDLAGSARYDQIMDLKKLLDFTRKRLQYLEVP